MNLSVLVPTTSPHATPCSVIEDDLWFSQRPAAVEQAKELCLSCPLVQTCLQGALDRQETWGVWGGQLVERGVVVPRKKPMGRPRKADIAARQADEREVQARRDALNGLRRTA